MQNEQREAYKTKLDDYILANGDKWTAHGNTLLHMPECGFKEYKTTQYMFDALAAAGIGKLERLPVTGCLARIPGAGNGPCVAVMAELDAVYCPGHPLADADTGMAHVCGHNAQQAMLLTVAHAVQATGVMEGLPGEVVFIALPAEESLPDGVFEALKAEGAVQQESGKMELLRLGYYDNIDATLSVHAYTEGTPLPPAFYLQHSCNGCTTMELRFAGKAAHPSEPDTGINALNAAVLAINGLMALRETFREDDTIRMNYIIKDGGTHLASIPEKAVILLELRTKRLEKLEELVAEIGELCKNAAEMVGAGVSVVRHTTYAPYAADESILSLAGANAARLGFAVYDSPHGTYCTDLGNVSQKVPSAHFSFSGFSGELHAPNYKVEDDTMAYVNPARVVAATLVDLLAGQAPDI